ncbi:hypothetical protein [Nocardia sp. NPDC051570]|uniref:WXG100-like domain-containing protein n=1 Tax=Nocardia sp. NPDC051570 TaxID=3364324 RepID=UPI0037AE2130
MGMTIPSWLEPVMGIVAGPWPHGDETAMRRLGDAWSATANALEEISEPTDAAMRDALSAVDGDIHEHLDQFWDKVGRDKGALPGLAQWCDHKAKQLYDGANDIELTKYVIIGSLVTLAAQLAFDIFVPLAGEVEAALAVAATRVTVRMVIKQLIEKLMAKGLAGAAAQIARRAAIEGAIGAGLNAGVNVSAQALQYGQGNRHDMDWGSLGETAGMGALAGAPAGLAGRAVGSVLRDTVESAAGRLGTNMVASSVGGGVGAVAGGVAPAAWNGGHVDLNARSVFEAAVVGGGTAGAGHGGRAGAESVRSESGGAPTTSAHVSDAQANAPQAVSQTPASAVHPVDVPPNQVRAESVAPPDHSADRVYSASVDAVPARLEAPTVASSTSGSAHAPVSGSGGASDLQDVGLRSGAPGSGPEPRFDPSAQQAPVSSSAPQRPMWPGRPDGGPMPVRSDFPYRPDVPASGGRHDSGGAQSFGGGRSDGVRQGNSAADHAGHGGSRWDGGGRPDGPADATRMSAGRPDGAHPDAFRPNGMRPDDVRPDAVHGPADAARVHPDSIRPEAVSPPRRDPYGQGHPAHGEPIPPHRADPFRPMESAPHPQDRMVGPRSDGVVRAPGPHDPYEPPTHQTGTPPRAAVGGPPMPPWLRDPREPVSPAGHVSGWDGGGLNPPVSHPAARPGVEHHRPPETRIESPRRPDTPSYPGEGRRPTEYEDPRGPERARPERGPVERPDREHVSPERTESSGSAAGHGDSPSHPIEPKPNLGDMFPPEGLKVDQARLLPQLQRAIDGEYGGLRARVEEVSGHSQTLHTVVRFYDANGVQVGHATRTYYNDGVRILADHTYFRLQEHVRGQGCAADLNKAMFEWYRQSGVDQVVLRANIDVGSYAWARQGFEFANQQQAVDQIRPRLFNELKKASEEAELLMRERDSLPEGPERSYREARLKDLEPAIDRAKEMLEEFQVGSSKFPKPQEISQLGRPDGLLPGQSRELSWLGKRVFMEPGLRISWAAVKSLKEE